ncbi:glycosyltransferase family 2 protein [Candidatus Gracilibacteria bacterium]|nr:glycosyltransferase family 2 protein [Candidatus Gracilibacteria bacterium]
MESYISECLLSIFQFESTLDREIIVVDDCSSDSTVHVMRDLITKYPQENIQLIQNIENLGPAGSYNRAVEHSHGRYITFLDSDDFLIASGLESKIKLLENNTELQVVYGNGVFYERGKNGLSIQSHMVKLLEGSIDNIQKKLYTTIPMLSVSCSVMRRDFFDRLGGFDPLCQSNDWVLNIRIFQYLTSREQFSYILDPVFAYRMHANNISKDQNRMIGLLIQVVDRYIPIEYREKQYANIYFFASLNLIIQRQYCRSLQLFRTALSHELQFARVLIYCIALVSPTRFIADRFPRIFFRIKQIIQSISK